MRSRPLFLLALLLFVLPAVANAQWAETGTTVSAEKNDQRNVITCSDGAGGAIIVWEDYRLDPFISDLYAQRISSTGVPLWTSNGVVVCNAALYQYHARMISDGAGGAIITWADYRSGSTHDVYAQRINSSGTSLWTANGVVVSSAAGDQWIPNLVSDGAGGAIIAWNDFRTPANSGDMYAQKLNSSGVAQWTANGVAVSTALQDQTLPHLASDGANGAIISWRDSRPGSTSDIYAQRVLTTGSTSWTANGVAVCTSPGNQDADVIISDGANGAIIAWRDGRSGTHTDIYAQRFTAAGSPLWAANGLVICNQANDQFGISMIPDGNQGAFIAWTDARTSPTNNDVYAQHLGGPGTLLWAFQGQAISTGADFQQEIQIVSDGANGVIAVWADARGGTGGELYTQRLNNNGTALWTAGGVRVTTNAPMEFTPLPVADGSGNMVVGWYAYPNGLGIDANVYATRIDGRFGYWGKPEPTLFAVKDVPNDQGGKVRVEWYGSGRDALNQNVITHYTVWRAIDQAAYASATEAGVPVLSLSDPGAIFRGKAVRHEKAQAVDYFWELIGEQDAFYRYAYSFTAETSFDSTAANAATHRFQVLSHATSQLINWPSNILTGRSVDNLAPPAPLFLMANRVGADVLLEWNRVRVPDLENYQVYRATSTGVTPIPPNFLTNDDDTLMVDASAPGTALYYIVTAKDVHGNQGVASNEASVSPTTGAGNTPPITALTVLQNHPNPFSGETALRVGLPVAADVSVEIYDVAGRRVREQSFARQAKGWSTLRLDSRDRNGALLPSGVYFYRVRAGTETVTNKMVIAR